MVVTTDKTLKQTKGYNTFLALLMPWQVLNSLYWYQQIDQGDCHDFIIASEFNGIIVVKLIERFQQGSYEVNDTVSLGFQDFIIGKWSVWSTITSWLNGNKVG